MYCKYCLVNLLDMTLHSIKLLQLTHVRSLHTSGCGQQQEAAAAAAESDPEPFSVFRTQENDPVSKSDFTRVNVVIMVTGMMNTVQLPHCLSLSRHVSQRNISDSITNCPPHTSALCSLTASLIAINNRYVLKSMTAWTLF